MLTSGKVKTAALPLLSVVAFSKDSLLQNPTKNQIQHFVGRTFYVLQNFSNSKLTKLPQTIQIKKKTLPSSNFNMF